MLTSETKRKIDGARQVLVGTLPNPMQQVELITTALIYKFMDDMDEQARGLGGKASFFTGDFKKYSWHELMDTRNGNQEKLNLFLEALKRIPENKNIPQLFRDIFKNVYLPFNDPRVLGLFLSEINQFSYDNSEELGNAYEYLLDIMGSQGDAGQFRTPRHIIDFIVKVIDPKKEDRILDPACGTGGFLISAYKHILEAHDGLDNFTGKPTDTETVLTSAERAKIHKNIIGFDIDPNMVKIAQVNTYLHKFINPDIRVYDTLSNVDHWDEDFDVILANPPFMTPKGGIQPHSKFRVKANRAEVLFVDYIVEHLRPKGRAGIIVPEGIIFQSANAYKKLRKELVEDGLYAVVSLPSGVFNPYSGVKTSILLFDKDITKKNDEILFLKVEQDGYDLGAQRRETPDNNDLPQVIEILKEWKEKQEVKENQKLAFTVKKSEIAKSETYDLTANKYREEVDYSNVEWEMVELGDVCDVLNGYAFRSNQFNKNKNGLPIIRIRDVNSGFSETYYEGDYDNKFLIENDDFLIGMDGDFNALLWNNGKALLNQRVCKLHNFKNAKKEYILAMIQKKLDEIHGKTIAVTVRHISSTQIKKIKIPLPPLKIQEKIVEELDNYQKVIDGAKQVVENWKPNIKIDSGWEVVELGEICKNLDGKRIPITKSDRKSGKYPYYGASRVVDYVDDFIFDESLLLISEDGANLLARSTPIAFSVNGKIWVNNHAHVLRFENLETQKLVEIYINSINISEYVTGMAQPKLNQKALKSIKIPLPPLKTQEKIVAEIETEQEIVNQNKKLIEIFEKKIKDKVGEVWGE